MILCDFYEEKSHKISPFAPDLPNLLTMDLFSFKNLVKPFLYSSIILCR